MTTLTCIECPNGCTLTIEKENEKITVSGNKCKRGAQFAEKELTNPMRTVTSTVKTAFPSVPVLPVRVSGEIPKDRIFDLMKEVNEVVVKGKVGRGDVIIKNVLGLNVDLIATSDILKRS